LDLPEGRYMVTAKAQINVGADQFEVIVFCTLETGAAIDQSSVRVPSPGAATVPFLAPADLTGGPGQVVLHCEGDGASAVNVKLAAVQVSDIFVAP